MATLARRTLSFLGQKAPSSWRSAYPTSSRSFCLSSNCLTAANPNRRKEPAEADTFMDIGIRNIFNEEHDMLRVTIRKFFTEIVAPNQRAWEERGYPDPQMFIEAGKLGLCGINSPAEEYGVGGDTKMASIMWEEGCYACCSSNVGLTVHNDVVLPYLVHYGTPEQKAKFIPKMISGEWIGAIAMTEPGAGSDLQGVLTVAKKDGDDWIVNGSKTFITNGYNCDFVIVVARTDTQTKNVSKGISLVIVEKEIPGFTKGKPLKKLGMHGSDTAELFFDDVRVPAENIVGQENKGFYYLMNQLPIERLTVGSGHVAMAEFMFEETRSYVKQRKAFGRTLADLQTIQHKLAEMKTAICAARAFSDQAIDASANGTLTPVMASMIKYWGTDLGVNVGFECTQLHGGMGFMEECSVTRTFASSRVGPIYAGTNEIMKELIGRDIVRK